MFSGHRCGELRADGKTRTASDYERSRFRKGRVHARAGAAAVLATEAPHAAAAATGPGLAAHLAFDPNDPNIVYDLVVTGGTVIDPAQKLNAKRDVVIKNSQIAALLGPGTPVTIVTLGLVDMRCHYYHQVSGIGLPTIASIGLAGDPINIGELFNIDYANVERCAKASQKIATSSWASKSGSRKTSSATTESSRYVARSKPRSLRARGRA